VDLPSTICMLPWTSLEVTPLGNYRPCCIYQEDIPDMSVQQGHSIADAQTSIYMKDLRSAFLQGEKPKGCTQCWQEEKSPSRMSKRKSTFVKLRNVKVTYDETGVTPRFLDIKLGNICNLKCRICGSWSSSKWAQEEIDLAHGNNPVARDQLSRGQWPRTSKNWQSALDDALEHIEYLEITGGEPFLINEHFDLLQVLVDRGYSHKISIHYNTNGTVWPKRGPDLWAQFKKVEIAFSIDDTGERFEYQRYGSDWAQTQEVVKQARDSWLLDQSVHLQICTTFNILNSYYWPETEDWIIKQGIRDVHCNLLQSPLEFSLRNLPPDIKNIYEQKMRCSTNFSKNKLEGVIDFMNLPGQDTTQRLLDRLAKNDAYRKQSFSDAHFNVWQLLDGR